MPRQRSAHLLNSRYQPYNNVQGEPPNANLLSRRTPQQVTSPTVLSDVDAVYGCSRDFAKRHALYFDHHPRHQYTIYQPNLVELISGNAVYFSSFGDGWRHRVKRRPKGQLSEGPSLYASTERCFMQLALRARRWEVTPSIVRPVRTREDLLACPRTGRPRTKTVESRQPPQR